MNFIKGLARSIGMRILPLVVMVSIFYFFKDVSVKTSLDALSNYLIFSLTVVIISVTLGAIMKTSASKVKALVEKQRAKSEVVEQPKQEKETNTTSINFKIDLYMITIVVLTGLFITNIISLENVVFTLIILESFLLFVVLFTSLVSFIGLSLSIKNLKRL